MVTGSGKNYRKKYGNHVASPTGANLSKQAMQTNKLFCGIYSTAVDVRGTTLRIRMEYFTHTVLGHPCCYNFVSWLNVIETHHSDRCATLCLLIHCKLPVIQERMVWYGARETVCQPHWGRGYNDEQRTITPGLSHKLAK